MTDKVQKIREGIEKLKSNLVYGACASQVAMETRCKEEAYNDVLALLDTTQEEPVSEELEKAAEGYAITDEVLQNGKVMINFQVEKAFRAGAKWQKEHLIKDAVDGEIGYWNLRWLSVNADLPRTVAEGDKVKVILIKEK